MLLRLKSKVRKLNALPSRAPWSLHGKEACISLSRSPIVGRRHVNRPFHAHVFLVGDENRQTPEGVGVCPVHPARSYPLEEARPEGGVSPELVAEDRHGRLGPEEAGLGAPEFGNPPDERRAPVFRTVFSAVALPRSGKISKLFRAPAPSKPGGEIKSSMAARPENYDSTMGCSEVNLPEREKLRPRCGRPNNRGPAACSRIADQTAQGRMETDTASRAYDPFARATRLPRRRPPPARDNAAVMPPLRLPGNRQARRPQTPVATVIYTNTRETRARRGRCD